MTNNRSSILSANPATLLKGAIRSVPAVKFALGVVGVASAVAIILGMTRDPRIAFFGIAIMLGLMFILVIFAYATREIPGIRWLAALLAWAIAILFIATLIVVFTSFVLGTPKTLSERLFQSEVNSNKSPSSQHESQTALLSGTIIDQGDKPLSGARVTLDDLPGMLPAESNSDGVFILKEIPKKHGEAVRIRVVLAGYRPNPYTEDVVLGKTPPIIKLKKTK